MLTKLQNISNRQVLVILLGVAAGTSIISAIINALFNVANTPEWWAGWFQNLSTELFGAFMTFVLLEMLVRSREEKERLIRQMRSKDNALALQAVAELGAHGWLGDGSLVEASLWNANLEGVNIWDVNLKKADLHGANLMGAKMERANFTGTNLWNANLEDVQMRDINLEGADLFKANLRGAQIWHAEFDETTRLPDGTHWKPDCDLSSFGITLDGPD